MRLSFKAVKRFLDFSGTAFELAETLADLGFPNDGIKSLGADIADVLVGKIVEKNPHPQADRLSLLKVDMGRELLSIVCGASNMKAGDYVGVAPVGSTIPGVDGEGMTLKRAKIRGEDSFGMCCSEKELGLSDESDGILILPEANLKANEKEVLGRPVVDVMGWRDEIIEVDVTPNRGDALCVRALAREVGAKLGLKLKAPFFVRWKNPSSWANPSVENFDDAYGLAACLVKSVHVKATPELWKNFLQACGSRSINNLVDITNIVLFEMGHPIHFFDADKMDPQSICVRRAREGETLELLDGKSIELHPEDLVIADKSGARSLAGIMGGKASSVAEETKNVLIEVASFNPKLIRASVQRHKLKSESSLRFERGVMPWKLDEIVERALGLLQELSGFEGAEGTKVISRQLNRPSCLWNRKRVEAKLGKLEWSDDEIFDRLRRLDYELDVRGGSPKIVFPAYRSDAELLEDVMEDVARLVGYDHLEPKALESSESVALIDDLQAQTKAADLLLDRFVSRSYTEILNWSFVDTKSLELLGVDPNLAPEISNPIHSEKSRMRPMLLPHLIESVKYNAERWEENIRLVEFGPVFSMTKDNVSDYRASPLCEEWRVACAFFWRSNDAKKLWHPKLDPFFIFKGQMTDIFEGFQRLGEPVAWLNAYESSNIFHPRRKIGFDFGVAGEVHPGVLKEFDLNGRLFIGEWSLRMGLADLKYVRAEPLPPIDLDLSLLVGQKLSVGQLSDCLDKFRPKELESFRVYDVFESEALRNESSRAVTFALRYRSSDSSLSMDEVMKLQNRLLTKIQAELSEYRIALR